MRVQKTADQAHSTPSPDLETDRGKSPPSLSLAGPNAAPGAANALIENGSGDTRSPGFSLPLSGVKYDEILAAGAVLGHLGAAGLLFEATRNNDHLGRALSASDALERLARNETITIKHPTLKRFVGGSRSTTITGSADAHAAAARLANQVMSHEGVHLSSVQDLARFVALDLGLLAPKALDGVPSEDLKALRGMVPDEERAIARMLLPFMAERDRSFRWDFSRVNNVPSILTQGKGAELIRASRLNERVVTVAKPESGQGSGVFSAEPVSGFLNALFPGRNTKRAGFDPLSLTEAVKLLGSGGKVSLQRGPGTKPEVVGLGELRQRHEAQYGGTDPLRIDPDAPLPRYAPQADEPIMADQARRSRVMQDAIKQLAVRALQAELEAQHEAGTLFAGGKSLRLEVFDPAKLSELAEAINLPDQAARSTYEHTYFVSYDSPAYSAPPEISPSLPELERTLQAVLDEALPGTRALLFFDRYNGKELSLEVPMPADHRGELYARSKQL